MALRTRKGGRLFFAVCAAGLVFIAGPAGAAESPFDEAVEPVYVLENDFSAKIKDTISQKSSVEHRKLGLPLGRMRFFPRAEVETVFGDNLSLSASEGSDYETAIIYSPGIDLQFKPDSNKQLDMSYTFSWTDFLDNFDDDFPTNDFNLRMRLDEAGSKGLSFGLFERYISTSAPGGNALVTISPYEANDLELSVGYRFNRVLMTAKYGYGFLGYNRKRFQSNDYTRHTVGLGFVYALTPRMGLKFNYGANLRRTEAPGSPKDTTHNAQVGVRGFFKGLTYDFGAGVVTERKSFSVGGEQKNDDSSAFSFSGRLSHVSFNRKLLHTIYLHRDFEPSGTRNGLGKSTAVGFEQLWRFNRRISFDLKGDWRLLETEDEEQKTWSTDFSVRYRLLRRLEIEGGYGRLEDLNGSTGDVTANKFTFNVSWRW